MIPQLNGSTVHDVSTRNTLLLSHLPCKFIRNDFPSLTSLLSRVKSRDWKFYGQE